MTDRNHKPMKYNFQLNPTFSGDPDEVNHVRFHHTTKIKIIL